MKKNKNSDTLYMIAKKYQDYLKEEKEIKNANDLIIEKKGDFLRIGNNLINLKNIDAIVPDIAHNKHFSKNVKIAYAYFNTINSKKAIHIIIKKIMKAMKEE